MAKRKQAVVEDILVGDFLVPDAGRKAPTVARPSNWRRGFEMDRIDPTSLPEWDASDYLTTPLHQAEYLSLVMEDGDEAEIAHALAAIARAQAKTRHSRRRCSG